MNDLAGGSRYENTQVLHEYLKTQYALDASSTFSDLGGGFNLNLLAHKNGVPVVIRIYKSWVTEQRLIETNRVITALSAELPVPKKLPDAHGNMYCKFDGRLIEMEAYVPHDSTEMNTFPTLTAAMPLFGRMHSIMASVPHSQHAAATTFTNFVSEEDCLPMVKEACDRIRSWSNLTDFEKRLADNAEALAERLEAYKFKLPFQLTHGDFWDGNVRFREGEIVYIGDFDFLGERSRIDDLALTLYFADAQFSLFDPYPGDRFAAYREMFRRYQTALDTPWSDSEREAMPYAMARQPMWGFAKWVRLLDEVNARNYISDMEWYVKWGHAMIDTASQWVEKVFQ